MRWRIRFVAMAAVLFLITTIGIPVLAVEQEEIAAPSAILIETETGRVLFEKNADEVRPCASITKVMTLLLVMEAIESGRISLEDQVAASAHAASMGGSDIWLKEGEVMSVDDLIKATVIMSANDAAVVLAEHVYGTEEEFVRQMNLRAQQLGMEQTVFKNCNGLDEDGHVTTARDVAVMSAALIAHQKIMDYTLTWMDYVRDGQTQLVNTNKLIRSYKGITGLKTGTTSAAGSCITATAKRGDLSLAAVVLGCATTQDRFDSAATLLDYGFANFAYITLPLPTLETVPVTGGMQEQVPVQCMEQAQVLVEKGRERDVQSQVTLDELVQAPVAQGQILGRISYLLDGEVIAESDVTAAGSVQKMNFSAVFFVLLGSLFRW